MSTITQSICYDSQKGVSIEYTIIRSDGTLLHALYDKHIDYIASSGELTDDEISTIRKKSKEVQ